MATAKQMVAAQKTDGEENIAKRSTGRPSAESKSGSVSPLSCIIQCCRPSNEEMIASECDADPVLVAENRDDARLAVFVVTIVV